MLLMLRCQVCEATTSVDLPTIPYPKGLVLNATHGTYAVCPNLTCRRMTLEVTNEPEPTGPGEPEGPIGWA